MTGDPADDTLLPSRSRRRFLALTASAVAAAGCTSTSDGGAFSPTPTPDTGADNNTETIDGDGDGTGDGGDLNRSVGRPLDDWPQYTPDWSAPTTSPLASDLDIEILVENLEIPWDMSFAPDGTLFLTERVGRVLEFDGGQVQQVVTPARAIDAKALPPGSDEQPWYVQGGEGGTLGIAVHPGFPDPSEVFVYYTTPDSSKESGVKNRVDAFDVRSDDTANPIRTVVDDIPGDNYHNGGRLEVGPRNYLWITCGEALSPERAQDRSSLGGKVLRVTPDGDPAPGNPNPTGEADPRVFTYGHRNPQGVVWLPDGTPVASEHGPNGRDEINRLEAGDDYGWGLEGQRVRKRGQYPGSDVHKPLYNTARTSFAPTGSVFYTGDRVPALRNRMLTGGLISQQLVVTTLTPQGGELPPAGDAYEQVSSANWSDEAYAATVHTLFENELGRIRHVEQGPDGGIYVSTSNRDGRATRGFPSERDDVLARIRPA